MSYRLKMTDTAINDLREIALYIAEESQNKEIALRFIDELQSDCIKLKDHPNIGAYPMDRVLKSRGYRFLVHGEYLIFYSINEEEKNVYIEAVFNSKKDYTRVLKKMI